MDVHIAMLTLELPSTIRMEKGGLTLLWQFLKNWINSNKVFCILKKEIITLAGMLIWTKYRFNIRLTQHS